MKLKLCIEEFIGKNLEYYCDTCKTRFEKNPMRILDCKERPGELVMFSHALLYKHWNG